LTNSDDSTSYTKKSGIKFVLFRSMKPLKALNTFHETISCNPTSLETQLLMKHNIKAYLYPN